jgi:hypothetical protein
MTKPSKTSEIIALLQSDEELTPAEIAERLGVSFQLIAHARSVMDTPRRRGRPSSSLARWLVRAWPLLERVVDTMESEPGHTYACRAFAEWEAKNPRPKGPTR